MKDLAEKIVELVGGKENIINYTHCATRLRFEIKDKNKIQEDSLKALEKVLGVVDKAGQYQVIIGPDVSKVYNEVQKLCPIDGNDATESKSLTELSTKDKIKKAFNKILDYVTGSITPTLPVITAYGMIQALLLLLVNVGLMSDTSSTYTLFSTVANAAMYFLPAMIAFSAAQKLKTSPYLAAFLSLAFISSGINGVEGLAIFGIKAMTITYSSNIIPVLLMVPVLMLVERIVDRYLPKSLIFVVKPVLISVVMVPLILLILGPAGTVIGTVLANFCVEVSGFGAISIAILSFLNPVLVLTGTHTVLIPLIVNEIATYGCSYFFVKSLASNFASVGVALAVFVKAKKKENKDLALSTGITQLFGVGEPLLYGISIRLRRPFLATMIASGIAGLFLGFFNVCTYATASPGLFTLPIFIGGNDMTNFYLACAGAVIAIILGFIVTYIMGFKED